MADVFDEAERSRLMARVRSRGNRSTEVKLATLFRGAGITGWRRSYPIFGKPDFVFTKQRVAVFVDGCFWHQHECSFRYTPKSRLEFWLPKFAKNVARDRLVTRILRSARWRVIRIWECDLVPRRHNRVINRVRRALEFAPLEDKTTSPLRKVLR